MKQLIVNADDFGISRSVNRGIIEAFQNGIVTSTSLMANGTDFFGGIDRLKENPQLGTGIHLNILRGEPLIHPRMVNHLIQGRHFCLKLTSLPWVTLSRIILNEIESEYRSQIERILTYIPQITHIDSEKHHHFFPRIFKLVCRLAQEYRIPYIRWINETMTISKDVVINMGLFCLSVFKHKNRQYARHYKIKTTDQFCGIKLTGQMTERNLCQTLNGIQKGVSELCCHPGYIDAEHRKGTEMFSKYYIDNHRENELAILCSHRIRRQLDLAHIHLTHFGEINK